jgi:hypothetical protein
LGVGVEGGSVGGEDVACGEAEVEGELRDEEVVLLVDCDVGLAEGNQHLYGFLVGEGFDF